MSEGLQGLVLLARPPRPRRRRGLLHLLALGVAGTALLGGGIWAARSEMRLAAEAQLQGTVLAAAQETERAIVAIEGRQLALAAWLRGTSAGSSEELRRRVADAAEPGARVPLALFDAEARPIAGVAPPSLLSTLAEGGLLQEVRQGAARALGAPVQLPGAAAPALPVLRRLDTPTGEFLGVAIGLADLAALARLQDGFAASTGGNLRLLRSDRPDAAALATEGAATPLPRWLLVSAEQALPGFPLLLRAEAPLDAVLAPWRGASGLVLGGAVLLLGGLAAALHRARREGGAALDAAADRMAALTEAALTAREAAEERQGHRRELETQAAAFNATLGSIAQGVLTFGRHARLVLANTRCAELTGIPLELLRPGTTFAALAAAVREADAEAAALLDRLLPLVVKREGGSFTHQLDARRSLLVLHRPLPDGGWLASFEDAGALRTAELRLQGATRQDALTGLPNAAHLRAELSTRLPAIAAAGGSAALLLLNIDRFRGVNEALGRAAGDALLQAVAARLRRLLRPDRGGAPVVRLCADEFAVLHTGEIDTARLAERLVAALGRPYEVQGYRVVTTVSVGIAPFPASGAEGEELLNNAALAMRAAKGAGRGGYAFYAPEMASNAHLRRLAELDLRLALTEGAGSAFEVRYRPVLDLPSRRVVGLEALLCWVHPVYGVVEPEVLLPLATDLGLAAPLGRLLLRRACLEAAPWAHRRLSIPLSAAQLLDPGLVERVASAAAGTGLTGGRLEILVREGDLLGAPELMLDTIARLRAGGVRVVLDELGAFAPTPAALRAAPFDRARLAPGLVRELGGRGHGLGIVRAMSDLCAAYGIPLAAGGVETEEQLQHLAAERCNQAAGPLFGAAVPARELPALLAHLGAAG